MKNLKRPEFRPGSWGLILCLLLMACQSGVQPVPVRVNFSEKSAEAAFRSGYPDRARSHIEESLREYTAIDDQGGQLRCYLLSIRVGRAAGDMHFAGRDKAQLIALSENLRDPRSRYLLELTIGQLTGETSRFEQALRVAITPVEQALALTYLHRESAARRLLDDVETDAPADRAFVFFRSGIVQASAADLERALKLYKIVGDSRGIADALVHLSRLADQTSRPVLAKDYGLRAVAALNAMGDGKRADVIQQWLDTL